MIIFKNEGLLDIRAVKTLGVSVKKEGAIGYFGTGLKYALAVLLREQQVVTIYIGEDRYEFETRTENIQGKDFDLVFMNGEQMPFTTEFGKNWEVWMAFRELACNAQDEGGQFVYSEKAHEEKPNQTMIVVQGKKIEEAYGERDSIFYPYDRQEDHRRCDIVRKAATHLYYRGVRVMPHENNTLFTYNLKEAIELTEDRTAKNIYQVRRHIADFFLYEADEDTIIRAVTAPDTYFEGEIDFYQPFASPSESFMKVMENLVSNHKPCNQSAKELYKKLTKKEEKFTEAVLNDLQKKQLEKAINFLKKFEPEADVYPIVVCEALGDSILGMADTKTHRVYLSKLVFDQGTKQVATTLLEEFYHLKHGFDDRTYDFQNFLFDKILSLAELAAGEPI